jgi:hypothetical protein
MVRLEYIGTNKLEVTPAHKTRTYTIKARSHSEREQQDTWNRNKRLPTCADIDDCAGEQRSWLVEPDIVLRHSVVGVFKGVLDVVQPHQHEGVDHGHDHTYSGAGTAHTAHAKSTG